MTIPGATGPKFRLSVLAARLSPRTSNPSIRTETTRFTRAGAARWRGSRESDNDARAHRAPRPPHDEQPVTGLEGRPHTVAFDDDSVRDPSSHDRQRHRSGPRPPGPSEHAQNFLCQSAG